MTRADAIATAALARIGAARAVAQGDASAGILAEMADDLDTALDADPCDDATALGYMLSERREVVL